MTDRERLIELIETGTRLAYDKSLEEVRRIVKENHHFNSATDRTVSISEIVADFLLSNGVIVPPVQVGATVYCTDSYRHLIKPLEIIGFEVDYTKRICKYYCSGGDYTPAWFNPAEIGKTVFLTREEAEKALKESEENA